MLKKVKTLVTVADQCLYMGAAYVLSVWYMRVRLPPLHVCVCVRRLIVVVVVISAAGLLMKVRVIKSVHWGPRLHPASLKLHLIENGTAVMI